MRKSNINTKFDRWSEKVTVFAGSSLASLLAFLTVLGWLGIGPLLDFNEMWQLIFNTISSIVTFLMVFLIQHTQNKDSLATQIKLNELIAAMSGASNKLVNAENMTEEELKGLQEYYTSLYNNCRKKADARQQHSIEEASDLSDKLNNRE